MTLAMSDAHRATLWAMYQDFETHELDMLIHAAERTGLDPLARQIYASKRLDRKNNRANISIQATIDGFRVIAARTNEYEGQEGPFWCDESGKWSDVWLGNGRPYAAKVGVLRKGFKGPMWSVAIFTEYMQAYDGKPSGLWGKMGATMIAKCAEALALRRAFPNELSGVYTADEMTQADNADAAPISAPVASYAWGDEEKARSEKQNAAKPDKDEAKAIADGWINAFRAMTHVDEVVAWLPDVIGAWDVSDKRHRGRVYKACQAHVASGMVEGLSEVGFVEAWGHHVAIARGALKGDEQS